ncbi:MAG: ATP-binding cassette domain-containing protein [Casimicrobiaceae bacterium]|nr:ATP-binding cassette domain-containing protein [Pseudomonadota bacterium]
MGDAEIVAGLPIVASRVDVVSGGTRALDGVDVVIEPRRRTFILGANGAGKSTLLRVLHGLVTPTHGRVTWGGSALRPAGQAMVFQRPVLLRRSAAGNLRHALALAGIHGDEARRRVDDALASVGLGAIADRPARVLSGGEQQRLALARAWALQPEVVFLDEPTASLDPAAARAVEAIVDRIYAHGTTIVMTTHQLAQAKRHADSVVFLCAGCVTECTEAAEFFRSPRSADGRTFLEGERL